MHTKLGNIFITIDGIRIVLGSLVHDAAHDHAMTGWDLAALIPVCRKRSAGLLDLGVPVTDERWWLDCACVPYESITDPALVQGDAQVCRSKGKRIKVGYIFTKDDPHGKVMYVVRVDVSAILKLWDVEWVHIHHPSPEEMQARMERENATP